MIKSPYFRFLQDFCPYPQTDITKAMQALHYIANIPLEAVSNKLLRLISNAVSKGEYESLEKVNVLRVVLDYIDESNALKHIKADFQRHCKEISYFGLGIVDNGDEHKGLFWIDERLYITLNEKSIFKLLTPTSHFFLKNAVKA